MSGSESGVYLCIKWKKLVTVLEAMYSPESMKDYFQIDKDCMIIDFDNSIAENGDIPYAAPKEDQHTHFDFINRAKAIGGGLLIL